MPNSLMKNILLLLSVLAAGRLYSQDTAAKASPVVETTLRVLSESVVRQANGDSVTFKRVEPPLILPAPAVAPATVETLSEAEQERVQRQGMKAHFMLGISATVYANGVTVLRWSRGAGEGLRAVCNVDFRYLAGIGRMETAEADYSVFMAIGTEKGDLPAEEAAAAQRLPVDGSVGWVLLESDAKMEPIEAERAVAAMQAVFEHFESHRDELMKLHAQREAERLERERAARDAPPPAPKQSVVHFWPLPSAQRELLRQERAAAAAAATKEGGTQP
jgi:hypothetical protein